ncbi:MAG: glycosyltransferase [Candidatus Omnitrophica bacterium]|nr:glycosyltransferase [Candidatus Omnitrophota bacterium]
MKIVNKPWGKEIWLELNEKYCYKRIYINSGYRTSLQYHERKLETNYVIEGEIELWLENEEGELEKNIMKKDSSFTILPRRKHMIAALTEVILQEASTPEIDDVIRVEDDAKRGDGRIEGEHRAKIGIFIPCYNVERSIQKVIGSLSKEVLDRIDTIITVDNHSIDNTLSVLKDIQASGKKAGKILTIIKNRENYGLGGSQKIAYQYFIDNGFTHFMIIHGDNQGDADEIAKNFLRMFDKNDTVDVILACRFAKGSDLSRYSKARIAGNMLFNFLTFVLTGYKMSDSGTGIIFYKTEILKRFPFRHLTNDCQFNPQLNILLYEAKELRIVETSLSWRDSVEESSMKAMNYCLTLFKILLNYRMRKTLLRKSGWRVFYSKSQKITPSYDIYTQKIQPERDKVASGSR